jgi:hypothetical protein
VTEAVQPVKDEDEAHPVASAWRPTFHDVVKALVEDDYALARGVPRVGPGSPDASDERDANQSPSHRRRVSRDTVGMLKRLL